MWNVKLWNFFLLVFPSVSSFGFVIPAVPIIVSFECHGKTSSSCFLRLPYDTNKSNVLKKKSQLNLFGLFRGDDDDSKNKNDVNLELIRFSNLEKSGNSNKDQQTYYKSLVEFLKEWSLFLEGNKSGMMTTPIQVSFLTNIQHEEEGQDEVQSSFGVKLSFQRVKSSYDDEEEEEDEKKEEKVTSEGGVLIVISQTQNNGEISIVAKRCDIEEGTLIKEMSEETIVQNLKDAMTAWKKEQTTKG